MQGSHSAHTNISFQASVSQVLLITEVAGIREGLQLDSGIFDSLSSLGLNDSSVDALLQVDKAPVVAHRLPG